jgi:glucosamine-6-phosphate deaminase
MNTSYTGCDLLRPTFLDSPTFYSLNELSAGYNVCMQLSSIHLTIAPTPAELGASAAAQAAETLRTVLAHNDQAVLVLATGTSQIATLQELVHAPGIDWPRVTCFHLDEYIGLPPDHPAAFRKYLRERFAQRLPLKAIHFVQGDAPAPQAECRRLGELIQAAPVDLALIGIGENGHLAFNDPPADFTTRQPYLVVNLDQACRRQQVGEGWFASLEDVPCQAISMSIYQIMHARQIVCSVPDARKAAAVRGCLQGPVMPDCPASILQQHPDCHLFLDPESASLLDSR